jgi:hypothetical protein
VEDIMKRCDGKGVNRRLVRVNQPDRGAEADWWFSVFDWRVVAGHG